MNKNSGRRFGGGSNNGGVTPGGGGGATLMSPPLSMNATAGTDTAPVAGSPSLAPPLSSAPSSTLDLRNSTPGTLASSYGTSPQDIVNAAYGPKVRSDTAGAGNAYGELIAGTQPAVVPQTPQSPSLAPPLVPLQHGRTTSNLQ